MNFVAFQAIFRYSNFDHLEVSTGMNPTLLAAAIVMTVIAAAALAFYQLRRRAVPATANWDGEFDVGRYRPMQRLITGEDVSYLYTAGVARRDLKQFQKQRRRLFERYLRNLESDFARLHASARTLLVDAPEDRPELAAAIIRQHLAFQRTVWMIRLGLHVPGFTGAAARVGQLLDLAESMGSSARDVQSLAPANY
jgi:hypothetical protein